VGDTVTELLARAYADPVGAFDAAAGRVDAAAPEDRVELLRVMGNACRELRQVERSALHLEAAVDEARQLGDHRLEGLAAMSLAATLSYAGDFERALELAGRSVDLLAGDERVTALSQRAGLLARAGRNEAALVAFGEALAVADDTDDPRIKGDLLVNRGVLLGWAGDTEAAERDTIQALELFDRLGHTKRVADVRHNLAWLAGRRGDLVEAFRRFDAAESEYEGLGLSGSAVFPDRSEALLAAGLTQEALALAERAVEDLGASGDDVDRAEASMLVARAALLADDAARAATASATATALFEHQDRGGWWAAATALQVEARREAGIADAEDVARIEEVVDATARSGLAAASADARVVAAELAADRADWRSLSAHLAVLDATRLGLASRGRVAVTRVRWLAAEETVGEALETCRGAVDEFGALTAVLGGTELRATSPTSWTSASRLRSRTAMPRPSSSGVNASAPRRSMPRRCDPPTTPSWRVHSTGCAPRSPSSTDRAATASRTERWPAPSTSCRIGCVVAAVCSRVRPEPKPTTSRTRWAR
jgi:tetratricopeptide (TPR) repeat protein